VQTLNFQHQNDLIGRGPSPTLLLFVIHYPIGSLPLTTEVKPIVAKQIDVSFRRINQRRSYQWTDFFDIEIALCTELNAQGAIAQLSPQFMNEENNDYFFKPLYNKGIPIERLALCLESLSVR
jgi:hypothetical protein